MEVRIAMTQTRCGQLKHMMNSKSLCLKLKLRMYQAAVVSLMTYGCETWDLSPAAQRRLNNANSLMLTRFTGKTIPQEARPASTSFNLVKNIRTRRLKWLGQILRTGPRSYQFQALKVQTEMGNPDNLLMNAPPHDNIEDLIPMAHDNEAWKDLIRKIQ